MERYANRSRNSGVVAFEIAADSITVKFVDGNEYLYTYDSAGAENVDQMVERLKFDLIYIENMSLTMDFQIILHTLVIMVSRKGK